MNEDEDIEMKMITDMFEKMFDHMEHNMQFVALSLGWCSCCFLENMGRLVEYVVTGRKIFICIDCMLRDCDPEGDCKIDNFLLTHDKYVTDKDKK